MQKLLTALRDPIWQFVAAVLTLAAIIVPLNLGVGAKSLGTLVITREVTFKPLEILDRSQPQSREKNIDVVFDGQNIPSNELVVSIYSIWNKSAKSVTPEDFYEPILAAPQQGVKILSIERSTKKISKDWIKESNDNYAFRSQLINSDDQFNFTVVLWVTDQQILSSKILLDEIPMIEFSGKIKDIRLNIYNSRREAVEAEANLMLYADQGLDGVQTFLNGRGIIALFSIAAFLILLQTRLMQLGKVIPELSYPTISAIVAMLILTVVTSEITVDVLMNKRPQHPIIYPLLLGHLAFVSYLLLRLRRREPKGSQ